MGTHPHAISVRTFVLIAFEVVLIALEVVLMALEVVQLPRPPLIRARS